MDGLEDRLRFSVVVPAYNESAYLGETLEALLAQDFPGRVRSDRGGQQQHR